MLETGFEEKRFYLIVGDFVFGVDVEAESAGEHGRVLRDDGHFLTKMLDADISDVMAVNENITIAYLNNSR